MAILTLVRHAKSDWSDSSLIDHDRPLNGRGRQAAPMMAKRLCETGVAPDRIISSTAVRARQTAAAFAEVFGLEIEFDAELYASSAETLYLKAGSSGVESLMIVAHDPGITHLAERFSGGEIVRMPTCAVATFTWSGRSLDTVGWSPADTWSFSTPR